MIDGDLLDAVRHERRERDVIVTGSVSVVRSLQDADLVDEYRLLTFPSVLAAGERLFASPTAAPLTCTLAERVGPAVFSRYDVVR
ncbi:MAG: dihydrofolate reductase family protein [Jatrophihabitans sp.]